MVAESWRPGLLSTNLCWRHYLALLRVDERDKRDFYEIEAVKNNWAGRELERQISGLLFERLALSKDKAGVMELATKGQEIARPRRRVQGSPGFEFPGRAPGAEAD